GGAGKANLGSDSLIAQGVRSIAGHDRGAQKSLGRDVRSFTISSALSGSVPGVTKLEGSTQLALTWMSNGARKTKGEKPEVTLTGNDLSLGLKAELPFSRLGVGTGKLVDWLSEKLRAFVQKAIHKTETETDAKKSGSNEALTGVKDMYTVTSAMKEMSDPAAAAQSVTKLGDIGLASTASLEVKLGLDGASNKIAGSLEFNRVNEHAAEIPKMLAAKLTRTKRILKIGYAEGKWSLS
ncbi:MAG: hypothetical protein ABIQ39_04735, partial [Ilumatobacteraceae bacterium]